MADFDTASIVASLRAVRQQWRESQHRSLEPGGRELPSRDALGQIIDSLKGALFPMRLGPPDLQQESEDFFAGHTLEAALHALLAQVRLELRYVGRHHGQSDDVLDARALSTTRAFAASLPQIRQLLDSDVLAAYQGDPAARSVDEVLLCYPGILAMIYHRLAHQHPVTSAANYRQRR